MTTMLSSKPRCPACDAEHPKEAIFCGACGKAVGELRYVREEFESKRRHHEKIADVVTRFVGNPPYFVLHLFWFGAWVLLNSGMIMVVHRFDDPPSFSVLGLLLSVEAVFMTGFLLISQNREASYESKRAELDYETNVRAYRLLQDITERLERIEGRLRIIEEKK